MTQLLGSEVSQPSSLLRYDGGNRPPTITETPPLPGGKGCCRAGSWSPLSPAILPHAGLAPCVAQACHQPGWLLRCRDRRAPGLELMAAQASLDPGCSPQRDKTLWFESTLPGRALAVGEHRNPLCRRSVGQRGLQHCIKGLSCPPVGLLSCASGEQGPGPGHCLGDATVQSSIPALLAVAPGAGRGQAQVTHPPPHQ